MLLKNKSENVNRIKSLLKNENILYSQEECYCYSTDASNNRDEIVPPDLVVFVESTEEVQRVVKYANQHEIPIICRGAGTNMVGACVCNTGGIVLNFSRMNKILDFNSINMTVTVQPGVVLGELKNLVKTKNLFFPPDPSNYRVSTIGGAIAQSSAGASSFKYGTIKDYVLSLKVVTADGRIMILGAKTAKDAVGYHLNQLIIGSEGTLAIVVEATLKLIPSPEESILVTTYYDNIETAVESVSDIISAGIYPATIDFMDRNSINTVEDYLGCNLDTNKSGMLLIEVDGSRIDVQSRIAVLKNILEKYSGLEIKVAESEEEKLLIWQARQSSYAATSRLAPDVISDDLIVPRENLSKLVVGCQEIAQKYNLKICLVGHVGDGNIHPQIALDMNNDDEFKAYNNAKSDMYALVMSLDGTISSEHGIGLEKKAFLNQVLDKTSIEYMKMIKRVFDPKNILNPNKIF